MSVSAYPVIKIDSASGSDSAASGAGPATALTGSAAVSTGTTVVLDAGTDLSGVAIDGSHVLYFADATAGNRNFTAINGKSGSGGATPTVTVEQSLASTTKSWAIGGKRASLEAATTRKLFNNNGTSGDAMPGWIVELQSGHSETMTAELRLWRAGDTTSGRIILRGASGAGTLPVITFNQDAFLFWVLNSYITIQDFECRNSAAGKTVSRAIYCDRGDQLIVSGMKIDHSNNFYIAIQITSTQNGATIIANTVGQTANVGMFVDNNGGLLLENNYIHGAGSHGISCGVPGLSTAIRDNIIVGNTGDGIHITSAVSDGRFSYEISGNTLDSNGSDGIEVTAFSRLWILNNIFSNNGGYGLKFSDAGHTDALLACQATVLNNQTNTNTSGAYFSATSNYSYNNCPWATGDTGLAPSYAGGTNYSIGTNLKAKGYPLAGTLFVGTYSTTYSYVDPGASQRQEAGASAAANPLSLFNQPTVNY